MRFFWAWFISANALILSSFDAGGGYFSSSNAGWRSKQVFPAFRQLHENKHAGRGETIAGEPRAWAFLGLVHFRERAYLISLDAVELYFSSNAGGRSKQMFPAFRQHHENTHTGRGEAIE